MPSPVLLYAFAALCLYVVCDRAGKWYRLRHIPGPWYHTISVLPLAFKCWRGRFHEDLRHLFDTYGRARSSPRSETAVSLPFPGPLVRIGPNEVICDDVPTMLRILGSRSTYNKAQWFVIARLNGDGDTMQSMFNKEQREMRKLQVMPAVSTIPGPESSTTKRRAPQYTGKDNDGFESCIDRAITSFVHLIDSKYISTSTEYKPLELASRFGFFSMDLIGEVAVSQQFGFLAEDRDWGNILRSYDMTLPIIQIMGNYPSLARMMHRWPISLVLPKEGDGTGFGAATR